MPWARQDLRGGQIHWLVTLSLRGRLYRFSDRALEVPNSEDQTLPSSLRFVAGLQPLSYSEEAALPGEAQGDASVSLSVLFQRDDLTGWADIADQDHDLGDAWAEVAEIAESSAGTLDDWKDRRIIVRGSLLKPTYAGRHEPVSFTVSERPWDDASLVPSPTLVVSNDTWPRNFYRGTHVVDDQNIGVQYSRVYGCPGVHVSSDPQAETLAMPAVLVEVQITYEDNFSAPVPQPARFMLPGHDCSAALGSVTIGNISADPASSPGTAMDRGGRKVTGLTPSMVADDLGHHVAMVEVAGTDLQISKGDEVYYSFEDYSGGGVWREDRAGPMRGAGDILEDLLQLSTLRVDHRRMESFRRQANAFRLDFWLSDPQSAWQIAQNDILPLLPASYVVGPDGVYFQWWPYNATAEDAVAHIEAGMWGGHRIGGVEVSSAQDVKNAFTLEFGFDLQAGQYTRRLRYAPTDENATDTIAHPLCYAAWSRYRDSNGRPMAREAQVIQSQVIWDPQTAALVLDWQARRWTQTFRRWTFLAPMEFRGLQLGDVVTYTDPDVAMTDQLCLVVEAPRGAPMGAHGLRTIPNWVRDAPP